MNRREVLFGKDEWMLKVKDVVQELIERAYRLEPGADFAVSREEFITLKRDADPRYLYLTPPGYEPYLLGHRVIVKEPAD